MLEERGLLKRIGVITHPRDGDGLPSTLFDGEGLVMSLAFKAAYEAAEQFSRLYAARQPSAGFLKTILLRRIGSSARAGLETARHLLGRLDGDGFLKTSIGDEDAPKDAAPPDAQEIAFLREVERNLAAVVDRRDIDPKVQVILHYLRDGGWLETNGAIIFSQYRTTAEWVARSALRGLPGRACRALCRRLRLIRPARPERRTAGASKSRRRSSTATFGWCARPMRPARD